MAAESTARVMPDRLAQRGRPVSAPLWKATAPSGRDFRTGTIDYATQVDGGIVMHPTSREIVPNEPATYLSVSTEPGETLIGGAWPCRLFRVEAVGNAIAGLNVSPHKRAVLALRVVEEVDAWRALGPNGREVAAIIARVALLTRDEIRRLASARGVARDAAEDAARAAAWAAAEDAPRAAGGDAALAAARDAAGDAAGNAAGNAAAKAAGAAGAAARGAALAALVRDLITPEQFALLARPWESVVGPITSAVEGEQ